jgi:hypothetical protein
VRIYGGGGDTNIGKRDGRENKSINERETKFYF